MSQQFPGPDFHGQFKRHETKNGFAVVWHNADKNVTFIKPGIYIKLARPDGRLKEEKYFPFGEEEKAEEAYNEFYRTIKKWEDIK